MFLDVYQLQGYAEGSLLNFPPTFVPACYYYQVGKGLFLEALPVRRTKLWQAWSYFSLRQSHS